MTGHLLGAAGAVEAIASIMALERGIIPPTINHFSDDPAFDPRLNLTFNKAQKLEIKTALSNTYGFGGHNTSVILPDRNSTRLNSTHSCAPRMPSSACKKQIIQP